MAKVTTGLKEWFMVVFIPVIKESDSVREIKESFHEEEFLSKAFFARIKVDEHYKQKEHRVFFF